MTVPRTAAVLAWHRADAPPGPVTRETARTAAQHELLRPEYHKDDPSLLQRALDWFGHRVSDALTTISDATPGGLVGIVLLVTVVLGVTLLVRLRLGRLPWQDLFTDRAPGAGARTSDSYRAEADSLAAAGEWAEAVRARTRAVVRGLEERGVVDAPPGRTLDAVAASVGSTDLTEVVRAFGEVWYAGLPATADTDARLRAADARLTTAARV